MLDIIFNSLYEWMNQGTVLMLAASFLWGIFSIILSPCHLASIPLVIGFVNNQDNATVKKSFLLSLVFSLGIFLSIAAVGMITFYMGKLMGDIGQWPGIVIGAIFVVVGLYFFDVINFNWNNINVSKVKLKGYPAALILGILLGIGLGPCTFAFMAPVLGVIFSNSSNLLLTTGIVGLFALGHCGVIVFAGTMSESVEKYLNWSEGSKSVKIVKKVCGALVILGGLYLIWKNII